MILAVLLAVAALQEAPPLEAERERIRAKSPLTGEEKKAYVFPSVGPAKAPASCSLAVVPLEFTDVTLKGSDLEDFFFKHLAGYFSKVSGKRFELRGKVYAPMTFRMKRSEYRKEDLGKALRALLKREGEGLPAAFDGVVFIAAGGLPKRGAPLWPHHEVIEVDGAKVGCIVLVGDSREYAQGIAAHETLHLLGLPDKYADSKSEVGTWCIMGRGYVRSEPAPPCAACRAQLGWAHAAELDPRRPSRVVMKSDPARILRVPVNADGTEALLLEMRDALLVWHVGGGKEIEFVGRYPSETNDRLTPLSEPSFRGRTTGAWSVWVTDIRIEEGRAWFRVGPSAPLTGLEEWRRSRVGRRLGES